MIQLNGVNKSYDGGKSYAVADASFHVDRGEFLALIGESGCGKTTTLRLINRLEEPTSGEIQINGQNIQQQSPELLRRNIGYVIQGVGLFPHRNVAENVAAVPQLLGWSAERIHSRCEQILELVGLPLKDFGTRSPGQLSGGQQQRVGFARALAAEPEIILMDEPFGALDPITRSELQDEFDRIRKNLNVTVVMVTHDMTEALLLADRVAVMKTGELLQIASPSELFSNPQHDYVQRILDLPKKRADRLETILSGNPLHKDRTTDLNAHE